jgi:hypothetical protein
MDERIGMEGWMDRKTDKQKDGWTERQMNRWMDRKTDKQKDG